MPGPLPYQPAQIPPEIILAILQDKAKKEQQQKQQPNPFIKPAGTGGGVAGASQLTSAGSSAPAENSFDILGNYNPAGGSGTPWSSAAPGAPAESLGATPFYVPAAVAASAIYAGKTVRDMSKGKKVSPLARTNAAIDTLGFSELGKATGILGHKSTRDIAKDETSQLLSKFKDDPAYQSYITGIRAQYNAPPPDPSHPFGDTQGNKFKTWDEYKTHGLDAGNLSNTEAMLELGNQYTSLNPDQQKAVTQSFIDNNLLDSSHGKVISNNQDKGKQLFQSFISNGSKTAPTQNTTNVPLIPRGVANSNLVGNFNTDGAQFASLPLPTQKLNQPLIPKTQPVNNPNSPGFRNGKRIQY